jgi:phenylalanyl-tRNA synthetase beta chain
VILSENWLREWVNPDLDAEALAHTLTMAGLEVDAVTPLADGLSGVVVAEIIEVWNPRACSAPAPN